MSKPYMSEYRSTYASKMKHEGVKGEFPADKAARIAKGYAEGGEVEATPLPPSPFMEVKGVKKPRLPSKPATPPDNKM